MNDSQFAVVIALSWFALCFAVGALVMWIAMNGTHECSVAIQYKDHVAEYVTECRL